MNALVAWSGGQLRHRHRCIDMRNGRTLRARPPTSAAIAVPPIVGMWLSAMTLTPTFPRRLRVGEGVADDEVLEGTRRVRLHAGKDVLVGLDGERGLGVTEAFANHLDGHALFDEQRWRGCGEGRAAG